MYFEKKHPREDKNWREYKKTPFNSLSAVR